MCPTDTVHLTCAGAGDVMADVKMAYGDDADKDWATTWQR